LLSILVLLNRMVSLCKLLELYYLLVLAGTR
jgi:hypothetical protein